MNKRSLLQVIIIIILLLLLAFWGFSALQGGAREIVWKNRPKQGKFEDAPLSTNQTLREEPIEPSNSPPEQLKPILRPVSHSGWLNQGVYEVFGEIENEGLATARQVKAKAILKDGDWRRLAELETLVDRPTLAPGQKSKFKVVFRGKDAKKVGSYVLMTSGTF